MAENKIAYTSRTYDDCRNELIKVTQQYYPDLFKKLNDASIGMWLIEMMSDVYDALNFHIDRMYQETNVDSASQLSSLLNIARTNGLKIMGKKCALCEAELSCIVPISKNGDIAEPYGEYYPTIKRGSLFSSGAATFELQEDVNFAEQFDSNGMSNRTIEPIRDSSGNITDYLIKKLSVVKAGQSKVYKKVITAADIKPFMEILIQDSNITGVESVIVKEGTNLISDPQTYEYYVEHEEYQDKFGIKTERYFEVDNLIDQYRFSYDTEDYDSDTGKEYNPRWETISTPVKNDFKLEKDKDGNYVIADDEEKARFAALFPNVNIDDISYTEAQAKQYGYTEDGGETYYCAFDIGYTDEYRVVRGKWKRLKNKFITEYDDDWNLKVIFGAGLRNEYGMIPDTANEFTQYMMSRMEANDYMGVLPQQNWTIYVLYRVGGGEMSNIAEGTLTNIIYNNFSVSGCPQNSDDSLMKGRVRNSFTVNNPSPSYGGKDEPTEEEIKYMIKYNNAAQNRCVTLHDYKIMINKLPAKFGCPFRINPIEENNKVVIYALGLNKDGHLSGLLSETVADNIIEYLKNYKMLTDFVEMRPGKVINVSFSCTIYLDKTYDKGEVVKRIIDTIYDYMDIRKHEMGEDIFLGDLSKSISQLDGVVNMVSLKCYNMVGGKYSNDEISQQKVVPTDCNSSIGEYEENRENEIDLEESDMMLFSEPMSMYEIFDKNTDIIVNVKMR